MQIQANPAMLAPRRRIKVRISGDGTKFSRSSSFTFGILVPSGQYLSGLGKVLTSYPSILEYKCILTGNHTLAVVKGEEDYDTISQAFAASFAEINQLQQTGFVTVGGILLWS